MAATRKTTARARWKRRAYLEHQLAEYVKIAELALKAGSFQAAVRANTQADGIRAEIDQLDHAAAIEKVPTDPHEHLLQLLIDIRRLRAAATSDASYVAAAKLMQIERELVEGEAARVAALEPVEERDVAAIVEDARARLRELPDVLKAHLSKVS